MCELNPDSIGGFRYGNPTQGAGGHGEEVLN